MTLLGVTQTGGCDHNGIRPEAYSQKPFAVKASCTKCGADMSITPEDFRRLDPELFADLAADPLFGVCVDHPLVRFLCYGRPAIDEANAAFRRKTEELSKAEARGDWHTYIFLHERPYRFEALANARDRIKNEGAYWKAFGSVWYDTENLWQNKGYILWFLSHPKFTNNALMMTPRERRRLAALPGLATVYRGYNSRNKHGWSWTLSQKKAEWFASAYRSGGRAGMVAVGEVAKEHIVALLTDRKEDEIVADPENVHILRAYRVRSPDSEE